MNTRNSIIVIQKSICSAEIHEDVKKKYLTSFWNSCILGGMDKIYEETLLFDFYGELLTDRQKQIYGDVVMHDLSLGEAAEMYGISRQGVHDMIRRCSKILNGYEDKLHLVRKFLDMKKKIHEIESLTDDDRIKQLAGEILEEL